MVFSLLGGRFTLWAQDFFPSGAGLYSFNTATGVPTFVGNNGGTIYNGAGGFLSSLFESGGTLYGIHDNYGGVRSLYSIETSNGNLTSVGVITGGIPSVVGATVGPAASAPEPATLSLLALGALGGVMLRRQGAGRKEA